MVRYNTGRYIKAIAVLSITIFLAIAFLRNNFPYRNFGSAWEDIATTVTIVTIICYFFVLWAWKWRIFQGWLVPFPFLSGKWTGEINTKFNSELKTIFVEVFIIHRFFNIQIKVKTGESKSVSTCGSFDIDEERGLKQLLYFYQNTPKAAVRNHSEIHYGAVRLEISDDLKTLEGDYWTSRNTTGDIKLTKE